MSRKRLLPDLAAAARRTARALYRLRHERSGSYSMIVALLLPVIIGFVSLGTEVGLWFYDQQAQQTAADNAAYSAAVNYLANDSVSTAQTQAIAVASYQGYGTSTTAGSSTCTGTTATSSTCTTSSGTTCNIAAPATGTACVQVDTPPLYGAHAGVACGSVCYFEVIVAQRPQQLFSAVLFSSPVIINAIAVGRAGDSDCIVVLNSSVADAFQNSGSATLNLNSCGLAVNSTSSSAVDISAGKVTATSATLDGNCAGGCVSTTLDTTGGTSTDVATPTSDPYAGVTTPTCGGASYTSCTGCTKSTGGTVGSGTLTVATALTLSPPSTGASAGVCTIGGELSLLANTLTLSPGIYIVEGELSDVAAATLTGTAGVTLIIEDSFADIAGTAHVALSAPSSGPTAGVAIYQDRSTAPTPTYTGTGCTGNCSTIDSSNVDINGAIYFPKGRVSFSGASGLSSGSCTQVVADTVAFAGTSNVTLNSNCSAYGVSSPAQLVN